MFFNNNNVKIAISKLGGPTKASNLLGVSNGAVHAWIRNGTVPDINHAKNLSKLSGMKVEEVRPV